MKRRIISFLLVFVMVLGMLPTGVFAEETGATVDGHYEGDVWTQGGTGTTTYDVDGTEVSLSKTATPVAGKENTFNITLEVRTSTSSSSQTASGAVVLVIDVSGSMDFCAECGGDGRHSRDCTYSGSNRVETEQRRITAAKAAAREFLAAYAGTDANANRQIAIVKFAKSGSQVIKWTNVAGGPGQNDYDKVLSAINGLNANGGTNLDDGLYNALSLVNTDGISNANVVLLTDGVPTYRGNGVVQGDGSNGSSQNNSAAKKQADSLKSAGATIYTVCYGAANDVTFENGPTVGEFLSGSIATSPDTAWTADNSAQLNAAFKAITEQITSGLDGEGWVATDPMAQGITVEDKPSNFVLVEGDTYNWELANATTETVGNVTYYVYTLTYTVTLDVQMEGFVEGQYYPTNEPTYLTLEDGTRLEFPVPGVQGVLPRTSVTARKFWDDNDDQDGIRPDSVKVRLRKDDVVMEGTVVILNEENNWSYTWTDLIEMSEGHTHVYTVDELDMPEGYEPFFNGNDIHNSHTPETITIFGEKIWDDNNDQDGKRPDSITISLLADGEIRETLTVTAEDGWKWSFEGLDKYRDHGTLIDYTITEEAVDGYTTVVSGYNVTNTHEVEKTSFPVTKVWEDDDDRDGIRPDEITVYLYANGVDTGKTLTLTADGNWSGTFTDLDKYANGQVITYSVKEAAVEGYTTTVNGNTITNYHTPETVTISGTKTWLDNDDQDGIRPESITINLLADGEVIESLPVTAEFDWSWSFKNLLKYRDQGIEIVYTITEETVDGYTTVVSGYDVTNTHEVEKTSVTVTKTWDDNNNQDGIRAASITVHLYANGTEIDSMTLTSADNWTGTFADLDKYENGVEIEYTVKEDAVEGYETTIDGFHITNTHTPETISISGAKTWDDNNDQDGKRPESITITLVAGGQTVKSVTVTEADGWKWTFDNLPKFANGQEIVYTIVETPVDGYTATVEGFDVTNTHEIEKTSVTVTKTWDDADDQDGIRPQSITVHLLADGVDTGKTLTLTATTGWTGTFTDLDVYKNGKEIVYSITEDAVTGYTTAIDGNAITNTHTPETVAVSGAKTWVDQDNQDGKRPDSITINLLADGVKIDSKVVTEADGWKWNFENLPKYKDHGTLIVYTVTEDAVDEYTASYSGYDVINTHAPEKTSVSVSKAWEDANDQDGVRPEDITVVLVANGKETDKTLTLSSGNGWTATFENLDKYENGKVITYTVKELAVEGYTTVITGDQTLGYAITNTHAPAVVQVSGAKTWIDNNDQDGKRPDSITINLLADGVKIASMVVTESEGWKWSFDNLPKYKDHGTEIVYSVTEDAVEEYTSEYNGYNVVNTHNPEKVSVSVAKAWQDNNDQDGVRPDSVTLKLLANGVDTGKTLVLSEENKWTATFTDLDKYESGQEIAYTVEELTVEGYTTVITGDMKTGYTVTNTHAPETVIISGSKIWDDGDDQDGKRPESVTIRLLADGVEVKTLTVTAETEWTWTVENLPKYHNGVEIVYTVKEDAVEGYTATYDGFDVTNTYAPEEINILVVKAWADKDDADGKRPDEITIRLYANGAEVQTLVLTADMKWSGSFVGLPKYENGQEIEYTISEDEVADYKTVIRGDAAKGFTVTNSHTYIPQTGEDRTPALWMGLLTVSFLGICVAFLPMPRKKNEAE